MTKKILTSALFLSISLNLQAKSSFDYIAVGKTTIKNAEKTPFLNFSKEGQQNLHFNGFIIDIEGDLSKNIFIKSSFSKLKNNDVLYINNQFDHTTIKLFNYNVGFKDKFYNNAFDYYLSLGYSTYQQHLKNMNGNVAIEKGFNVSGGIRRQINRKFEIGYELQMHELFDQKEYTSSFIVNYNLTNNIAIKGVFNSGYYTGHNLLLAYYF